MLLYIIAILAVITKKMIHDCKEGYAKFDSYRWDYYLIDYKISCPKYSKQTIYISREDLFYSFSIFNDSNVILSCPSNTNENNLSLFIYDEPNIVFQNNFFFKWIEVFNSPTLDLSEKSTLSYDNILFHNPEYEIPNEIASGNKFICDGYFQINLTDVAYMELNGINLSVNYSDISKYSFLLEDGYFIISNINKNTKYYLSKILPSMTFLGQIDIFFSDLFNETEIYSFVKLINHSNIQIWMNMTWSTYLENYTGCPWEDVVYKEQYSYLKEYFDSLEENNDWMKVCMNSQGFLVYNENNGKVIIIPPVSAWIIIVSIIVAIVFILVSVIIIAYRRYEIGY